LIVRLSGAERIRIKRKNQYDIINHDQVPIP
jgi:hypothetical protein